MDFNTIKEMIIPEGAVSEIRNSLGNLIWKKSLLPNEYQQVEYIEANGTQYTEIDHYANSNTSSKGKFQITNINVASMLFGARTNSASNFYGFNWGGGAPYKYYNSFYNGVVTTTLIDNEVHTFEKKLRQLYVDDKLLSTHSYSQEWECNLKTIIFGCNNGGTIALFSSARIFNLQFFDGEELVIDLIPCYRKSDGEIGFYETVNKKFYTNKGTGVFLKGGDVENESNPYQKVEYIESTGTQYIDTGLEGIDGYTLECDMSFTEWFSTYNYISGCADGSTNRIYFTRYDRDGSQKFRYTYNNSSPNDFDGPELNERFTMKAIMEKGNQKQYINGVLKTSSAINTEVNTSQNIFLFCASYGTEVGNSTGNTSAKIYRAKYYLNGELVRDLVPCYRKKDNVIGMYDSLTNVFYGNLGEGEFLKGNNI